MGEWIKCKERERDGEKIEEIVEKQRRVYRKYLSQWK